MDLFVIEAPLPAKIDVEAARELVFNVMLLNEFKDAPTVIGSGRLRQLKELASRVFPDDKEVQK